MITMVLVNPFSERVKDLLTIDLNDIDQSLVRLSIARSNEKNNDKYVDLDERDDAVSLFLLLQSLAQHPHAPEVYAALTAYEHLIKERLSWHFSDDVLEEMRTLIPIYYIKDHMAADRPLSKAVDLPGMGTILPREDLFRLKTMRRSEVEYAVVWTDVYEVTDITRQYVVDGYLYLTKWELFDLYSKVVRKRCYDYVHGLSTRMEGVSHPVYEKISSKVKALLRTETRIERTASGDLEEELFPPCVRIALGGVSSGQRNYAITFLLTSFLSYARLIPSTKVFDRESSFTLSQEDVQILLDEVVPEIIEAGNRCDPPFFKEQPLEKLNILYHLGFGMTETPTVADYGKSKWYLPPSCTKIAENAPQLCEPDAFCSQVTWGVIDRERAEEVVNKAAAKERMAEGEQVLALLLKRSRTRDAIAEELGLDKKQVAPLLQTLSKNKLVGRRKITNPLIYYIRKKRASSRKA
jgi:DNA primase large subunit